MEIKHFPDPLLRKKSEDVKSIGRSEKKLLTDMAEIMYLNGGVGLAAVQVGIHKNMIVVDIGDGLKKMINPVISKREGRVAQEEGCLSVPEKCVNVKRSKKIVVDYLNEDGQAIRVSAEGLLARVVQHEIDHLFGKLILDYLSPLKKICNSLTTRKL
ncbi:MAG: peptide deformylase [Candidatus Omnitrophota bacterium]|jgi:peptide deformylase|nr:peptide deformylase [Candidatus Omnitrophota bacterium]